MMFIVFSVRNRSRQSPGAGWKKKDWNFHSNLVRRMDPVQCLKYQCYMHTLVWALEKLFNISILCSNSLRRRQSNGQLYLVMVRRLYLPALVWLSTKLQWGVPHYYKPTIAIVQLSSITGEFLLNVTQFKLGLQLEHKLKI